MSTLVLERLLKLDPHEFEMLLTELLTALGFEAEKTGKTGDGSVDVVGTLDVYGFASTDLSVQVKRYKLGNDVGYRAVKEFRPRYPRRLRGRSSRRAATPRRPVRKRKKKASRESA